MGPPRKAEAARKRQERLGQSKPSLTRENQLFPNYKQKEIPSPTDFSASTTSKNENNATGAAASVTVQTGSVTAMAAAKASVEIHPEKEDKRKGERRHLPPSPDPLDPPETPADGQKPEDPQPNTASASETDEKHR